MFSKYLDSRGTLVVSEREEGSDKGWISGRHGLSAMSPL